jgi:hypothetical protein
LILFNSPGAPPVHSFQPGHFPPQVPVSGTGGNGGVPAGRSATPEDHSSRDSTPEENRPIGDHDKSKDDRYKERYRYKIQCYISMKMFLFCFSKEMNVITIHHHVVVHHQKSIHQHHHLIVHIIEVVIMNMNDQEMIGNPLEIEMINMNVIPESKFYLILNFSIILFHFKTTSSGR